MSRKVMTSYPPGLFCWVDLVAHDLGAASRWYAKLFGWKAEHQVTEDGPPYVMFSVEGHIVAGAGQMNEEMKGTGMPPSWNSYVAVVDAVRTEAKARELGARITVPTMDVKGAGRLCFMMDPAGASIAVWEAGDHHGCGLVSAPGCLAWNEHVSRNTPKARDFYTELFGWTYSLSPMGDQGEYSSVKTASGRENGGMMPMTGEHWEGVPPHWMVYFAVDDIGDTVARVESSGGKVHVPITQIPRVGPFSLVSDPQGGMFAVIELSETD